MKRNISIIGMAGVGKSFTSKALADRLGYKYVSADELIAKAAGETGADTDLLSDTAFIGVEECVIVSLQDKTNTIIDTGGSVIYSPKAMGVLDRISFIVYLADSLNDIKRRFENRGEPHLVGMAVGMTFEKLFAQRQKLYEKYAHIKINVSKHKNGLVSKIICEYKKVR
ncbi:MAG TPA: shikimate kinase [Candidatus Nitrosopolaris sp.]|nr:shikimate kinase [Candidatus Nitrosopolaris sp.]